MVFLNTEYLLDNNAKKYPVFVLKSISVETFYQIFNMPVC